MNIHALHRLYRQFLYLENTHIIDAALATYVTKDLDGDPLWAFPYGVSGMGKTELIRPLMNLPPEYDIKVIDTVTSKSLTSGNLIRDIVGKKVMLLIPDLAGITAESEEEKKKIFSQFRTLFDGYIKRDTGLVSANADYKVKVNMLAFSTPTIKRDVEFSALMGTREILYELPRMSNNDRLYEKEINAEGRKEITKGVKKFIDNLNTVWEEPNQDIKKDIRQMATRISTWRVDGITDKDGFLLEHVCPEIPKRLYIQLIKWWKGLTKIGLNNDEVMNLLNQVERGTGNKLREEIFKKLTTNYNTEDENPIIAPTTMTLKKLSVNLNASPAEVRKQLMVLRSLDRVELVSGDYGMDSEWQGVLWEY